MGSAHRASLLTRRAPGRRSAPPAIPLPIRTISQWTVPGFLRARQLGDGGGSQWAGLGHRPGLGPTDVAGQQFEAAVRAVALPRDYWPKVYRRSALISSL